MIANDPCRICGHRSLTEVDGFSSLDRVTSDAKPWPSGGQLACCAQCGAIQKLASPQWLDEIQEIYGSYEIYHQAGGAEQPIFDMAGGSSAPRSMRIVEFLDETIGLGEEGTVLDFGCGNGGALASFAARKPQWRLFGAELSNRTLPELQRISGFEELYTCPAHDIAGEFDLVTLIHSLEHVTDPIAILTDLRAKVAENGNAFVGVPDCATTPYDLVVADHLMHFSLGTLKAATRLAGYDTLFLSNSVLTKELSWIGTCRAATEQADPESLSGDRSSDLAMVRGCVSWLLEQVAVAAAIADRTEHFGIFGSSISATWLNGSIGERARFFVDEDEGRHGLQHMGRPIIGPADVPAGAEVYVPLVVTTARAVASRLSDERAKYHEPPELTAAAG